MILEGKRVSILDNRQHRHASRYWTSESARPTAAERTLAILDPECIRGTRTSHHRCLPTANAMASTTRLPPNHRSDRRAWRGP